MIIAPLTTLIILDVVIIFKSMKSRKIISNEEYAGETKSLMVVVIVFIFCNFLGLVINFVELLHADEIGSALNYMVDTSNFLVVVNSSLNFFIYVTFGQRFRQIFKNRIAKNRCLDVWRLKCPFFKSK